MPDPFGPRNCGHCADAVPAATMSRADKTAIDTTTRRTLLMPDSFERRRYLTPMMMNSAGFPEAFFDSCGTPRPMNCTSPRAQSVLAGLPSTDSDILIG